MSGLVTALVVLALAPAVAWLVVLAGWAVRRELARRGGPVPARARLERVFLAAERRGVEQVAVHTELVDLPVDEIREIAGRHGFRLVGFERARGPLRRRLGVFVAREGRIAGVLAGGSDQSCVSPSTARLAQR